MLGRYFILFFSIEEKLTMAGRFHTWYSSLLDMFSAPTLMEVGWPGISFCIVPHILYMYTIFLYNKRSVWVRLVFIFLFRYFLLLLLLFGDSGSWGFGAAVDRRDDKFPFGGSLETLVALLPGEEEKWTGLALSANSRYVFSCRRRDNEIPLLDMYAGISHRLWEPGWERRQGQRQTTRI